MKGRWYNLLLKRICETNLDDRLDVLEFNGIGFYEKIIDFIQNNVVSFESWGYFRFILIIQVVSVSTCSKFLFCWWCLDILQEPMINPMLLDVTENRMCQDIIVRWWWFIPRFSIPLFNHHWFIFLGVN